MGEPAFRAGRPSKLTFPVFRWSFVFAGFKRGTENGERGTFFQREELFDAGQGHMVIYSFVDIGAVPQAFVYNS